MRNTIANEAAFDPTEMKAATGVGEPSYTSGAHMWNGTAAILKLTPATTMMTARTSRGSFSYPASAIAIDRSAVDPDRPYISDIPYSNRPRENAPSRKYL